MPDAQKRGIVGRARNLRAEFRREFAVHGRAMHADLLEQPSAHHRHHAAAAGLAGMVGALPGRAHEAPGLAGIERCRRLVFQPLERRADVVAQGFEPGPRARLAISITDMSILVNHIFVIARSERPSNPFLSMDCFASLAMTANSNPNPAGRNRCSSRCSCRGER
jgi:hypothetical protein